MTAYELCNCSPDELDKLTVNDLEDYFRPFWPVTRPVRRSETSPSPVSSKRSRGNKSTNPDLIKFESNLTPERREMLKELGLLDKLTGK